jgi:murein DD-endopeptidase MepM/ murein hydrolase activator NlpD
LERESFLTTNRILLPNFCLPNPMRLSSQSRFYLFIFIILGLLITYAGCGGRDLMGDTKSFFQRLFGPASPRAAFRKTAIKDGIVGEQDLALWDGAYDVAKTTPLNVSLPHREMVHLDNQLIFSAQALRFRIPAGRLLRIRALNNSEHLFGELFRLKGRAATKRPADWFTNEGREITYETPWMHGEELLLVVQTAPWKFTRYELQITTEPVLQFPVAGKDEKAIQSFWGAPRDGGKRKHEGNDIFAPKGTNLVAITDGEITRLTNSGIGGKTVWLYDRERGLRYYYAHLDEQLVRKGQRVQRGDVVGTVGNTGNARKTPPHLHFGIYDNGAIDPYPFLQRTDELPPNSSLSIREPAKPMQVPRSGSHYLRLSPGSDGSVIRQLNNGESVTVLGVTGRFRRVKTGRGEVGYANFD